MSIEDTFLRNTANSGAFRAVLREILPKNDFDTIYHYEICFILREKDHTPIDFRYLVITPDTLYVLPLQASVLPPAGPGSIISLREVGIVERCADEQTLGFLMPGLRKRAVHFQLRLSEKVKLTESKVKAMESCGDCLRPVFAAVESGEKRRGKKSKFDTRW
mmetsp:Transcript_25040/g.63021  ORF Transcript_25040/g.63021 Transcript_25040/m.63021 type:complete len:162 (-) Transcript_25040:119-604(-)